MVNNGVLFPDSTRLFVGVVKILRQDDVTIFPYGLHSGFAANGGCIGTADFFRPG
jgi:hypothetical protein